MESVEDLHFEVSFGIKKSAWLHIFCAVGGVNSLEKACIVAQEEECTLAAKIPEDGEVIQESEDGQHTVALRAEGAGVGAISLTADFS